MNLETSSFPPFEANSRASLSGLLPHGVQLTVTRWRKHPGGREFHDRYILTDVGGVEITPGIDEGVAGQCYTLRVVGKMDALNYSARFAPESTVYERWQTFEVD